MENPFTLSFSLLLFHSFPRSPSLFTFTLVNLRSLRREARDDSGGVQRIYYKKRGGCRVNLPRYRQDGRLRRTYTPQFPLKCTDVSGQTSQLPVQLFIHRSLLPKHKPLLLSLLLASPPVAPFRPGHCNYQPRRLRGNHTPSPLREIPRRIWYLMRIQQRNATIRDRDR